MNSQRPTARRLVDDVGLWLRGGIADRFPRISLVDTCYIDFFRRMSFR